MFQSLSCPGQTFGIISWLLCELLALPFLLFHIHSSMTQRSQDKGGDKHFPCSQAVRVGAGYGRGSAVRVVPQRHELGVQRLCIQFPSIQRSHIPWETPSTCLARASWQGVVELAVMIKERYWGTTGDISGDLIISLLTPACI